MTESWKQRIESDALVLRGKTCFKGTGIPVALVLGYLAADRAREDIMREFPDLHSADIAAALEYARDLADFELTSAL